MCDKLDNDPGRGINVPQTPEISQTVVEKEGNISIPDSQEDVFQVSMILINNEIKYLNIILIFDTIYT